MGELKPKTTFSMKTGLLIALFSLIITAVFAVILVLSPYFAKPQSDVTTMLYPLDESELYNMGGNITLSPEKITNSNQMYVRSVTHYMKHLFPFAALFCLFVFLACLILWILLKRLQQKQMNSMIHSVQKLNTDIDLREYPAFASAIEEIRRQYQNSLDDYKRLNAYLSHEQKNALAILRTNIELSSNSAYLRNLDDLTAGIDDILTLSETQGEETMGTVDVSLVCAAVCDSYRKITDTITFTFDETTVTEILAKERWIYRAVSNLIDNAIKYGKENPIEVSVRAKNRSVIVSVKDNGIGIASEQQEMIFRNRCRVNEQHCDGYGIGLSLVSHVCDLCGGFVTLESELGVGTTFYLSFPQLTPD